MFILLKDRKGIFNTTSMLMLAKKKVFLKNLIYSSLSITENPFIIIL